MTRHFYSIIHALIQPKKEKSSFSIFDPSEHFDTERDDDTGVAQSLNAAFLICLTSGMHPQYEQAKQFIDRMAGSPRWAGIAGFYLKGIDLIPMEIKDICSRDAGFNERLKSLSDWISNIEFADEPDETKECVWRVFFPEASGILKNRKEYINALRAKRTVIIKELNNFPIQDPTRELLFSSNVLLTMPNISKSLDNLGISNNLREKLAGISEEDQIYWYDHPIQIGVEPEENEFLYGLKGLEEAFLFERNRGNAPKDKGLVCLLSVSVTHRGLHGIAKEYLEEEIQRAEGLTNLDIYVFTEADTRRIVEEVISPAAESYLKRSDSNELLGIFGVDGDYGRHYSFLKAVSALWNVLVDPEIKATFKIDLDQVFPQKELLEQTGVSAFEHFKTGLWGAKALDSHGKPLELGMIAGSLVNKGDIKKSLFTPDVIFPDRELSAEEYIFFSSLPQALSTEAEMLIRYTGYPLDGKRRCIQRIHITGGTNGILVDSLRRYRPFTPSFIGRAEDQAYIMSVFFDQKERLAYAHKDGLIMRHDKEALNQEAIGSAYIAKLVGDYIRILHFSEYARALDGDIAELKDLLDPFTGCFISKIPISVTYLRFALKTASFFSAGKEDQGVEFLEIGAKRIMDALNFITGKEGRLRQQYEKEKRGWELYYDTLSAIECGLKKHDDLAIELKRKAECIMRECFIRTQ